ncbi:hypothetical protein K470DRAFT_268508 [Piedraia hortae CBS 480.64]|uniref:Peptidase C19 ubiquitin carboxyl-terminal hydrolase domain-containing protein n=1 Tax=Piedraia hortae CBS 480.64 TaxID=1314780 RepID=A0A6A7C8H8_9PEZI|nr:hypothetical protein K470DRAFT_268508 [Piedraia hortae CBS 480.64]
MSDMLIPSLVVRGKIGKSCPRYLKQIRTLGFYNKENLCYRNATYAALVHMLETYHYLGNVHKTCGRKPYTCTMCAMQGLLATHWNYVPKSGSPDRYEDHGPLHPAIMYLNFAVLYNFPNGQGGLEEYLDELQWENADFTCMLLEQLRSHEDKSNDEVSIEKLFDINLKSEWKCEGCGITRTIRESTQGVEIEPHVGKASKNELSRLLTKFSINIAT